MIGQLGYRFFAKETNNYYTVIQAMPNNVLKCEQDQSGSWCFVDANELKVYTDLYGHFSGKLGLFGSSQIDKTLTERGSRYGSFNDLAQISQALKEAMRATPGWAKLTASQKEALEMVQHKIARMLNGDPTYEDNAVDIVGYATLMMKNMQGDLKI